MYNILQKPVALLLLLSQWSNQTVQKYNKISDIQNKEWATHNTSEMT